MALAMGRRGSKTPSARRFAPRSARGHSRPAAVGHRPGHALHGRQRGAGDGPPQRGFPRPHALQALAGRQPLHRGPPPRPARLLRRCLFRRRARGARLPPFQERHHHHVPHGARDVAFPKGYARGPCRGARHHARRARAQGTAGHSQNRERAEGILRTLDAFLKEVVAGRPDDTLLVVTSDHGNIEDLSTRGHTFNQVPLIAVGPREEEIRAVDGRNAAPPARVGIIRKERP